MAGGRAAVLVHAELFLALAQEHNERIAAHVVVQEGAQPHAQGAGDLEQRPQGGVQVLGLHCGEETLVQTGAPGQVGQGQILLLTERAYALTHSLVHAAPVHSSFTRLTFRRPARPTIRVARTLPHPYANVDCRQPFDRCSRCGQRSLPARTEACSLAQGSHSTQNPTRKGQTMSEPHAQEPHAQVYRPEGGKTVKGLFSTQTVEKVGTGTTQRKTISKMYWYCVQGDDGTVGVQALNKNMVPPGPSTQVPLDDFLAKYNPEPEMYLKTVFPKMRELASTVTRARKAASAARSTAPSSNTRTPCPSTRRTCGPTSAWGSPTLSAERPPRPGHPGAHRGAGGGLRPGAQAPVQRVRHLPAQKPHGGPVHRVLNARAGPHQHGRKPALQRGPRLFRKRRHGESAAST